MNKKQYSPFSQFIFRTPFYPMQWLDKWEQISDTSVFKEAIFLASPDLLDSSLFIKEKKGIERRNTALYKYFSRACTRCTPFGLFAGCSVGTVGQETQIELEVQENYRRCTRLDMQYLCALIQKFEQNPAIRSQLYFYPNDSLYELGGKLRYIEYYYEKNRRVHQTSAIEASDYVSAVLERAKNGAKLEELAQSIENENISKEEAIEFVTEMVDAQLLKSELEPSVVGEDILTVLIQKLSLLKGVADLPALRVIQEKLNQIDGNPIGTTERLYADIIELIKSFGVDYELKCLFQTDLFKPVKTATISRQVCDDLMDVLSLFTALSKQSRFVNLEAFTKAFSERYESRTMPLLEVLDTELGLGYPYREAGSSHSGLLIEDLMLPPKETENHWISFPRTDALLLRKYVECIKNGKRSIVLTDDDFKEYFNKDIPDESLGNTISVMCSLIAYSQEDKQIYIQSVNNVGGASLLGRFCHLDAGLENLVRTIADKEKEHDPDAIIAEISHLPESRIGNIASRPLFRDFVIHYLSNSDADPEQNIPPDDLFIAVKDNKIVLTSRKYGKEVHPKLTCAHNQALSPIPFYRFLCDIQVLQVSKILDFSYGDVFSSFNYLPRLQYKNAILARQKWIIKKDEIKDADKKDDVELLSCFHSLMDIRSLNRHVVFVDGKREMYIDLQNPHSLHVLLDLVKEKEEFTLEEFLFDPDRAVVKDRQDSFPNEMIVIFHK